MYQKISYFFSVLLIVSIFLKVSSASNDTVTSAEYVKYQSKNLLRSVEFLRPKLELIFKKAFAAQDSIPRYYDQIGHIVRDNHNIVKARKILEDAALSGLNVEHCEQSFNQHIYSLINSTIHSFTTAALQHVRTLEAELKEFKMVLDNIDYALRFNEKSELASCATDYKTCNIMSRFSQELSERYKAVGYQEFHADYMIANLIDTLDFAVLNPQINDSIPKTAQKCVSDLLETRGQLLA